MLSKKYKQEVELESRPIAALTDKEVEFLRELRDDPEEAIKFVQWVLPKLPPGVGTKSFSSFARMYSSPAFGSEKLFNSDTNEKLAAEVEKTPGLALKVALKIISSWLSEEEVLGDELKKKPGIIDLYKSGKDVKESDSSPIEVAVSPDAPEQALPEGPGPAVTEPDPALDFSDGGFEPMPAEDELPGEFAGPNQAPFLQDDEIGIPAFDTVPPEKDEDEDKESWEF